MLLLSGAPFLCLVLNTFVPEIGLYVTITVIKTLLNKIYYLPSHPKNSETVSHV